MEMEEHQHQISAPSSISTSAEEESDDEGFDLFIEEEEDFLQIFRITRKKMNTTGFGLNANEFLDVVNTLLDSFRKGHMVGRFSMVRAFFEILLENGPLNNAGRKAIMWTVAAIFSYENGGNPIIKLTKSDVKEFKSIIQDLEVSDCDPKWDTIELLAIRNRFRTKLPTILPAIDELIPRIIVNKYKHVAKFQNVELTLTDFYPEINHSVKVMAKVVLQKLSEMTDFFQRCMELQEKYTSSQNKEEATQAPPYFLRSCRQTDT